MHTVGDVDSVVLILSTVAERADAERIADELLKARAAACVGILPALESHYVWNNQRECASEFLLLVKTSADHAKECQRLLRALHPYECPEILAFPASSAGADYARWVARSVGTPER